MQRKLQVQEICLICGTLISATALLYTIHKDLKATKQLMEQNDSILQNQKTLAENQVEIEKAIEG